MSLWMPPGSIIDYICLKGISTPEDARKLEQYVRTYTNVKWHDMETKPPRSVYPVYHLRERDWPIEVKFDHKQSSVTLIAPAQGGLVDWVKDNCGELQDEECLELNSDIALGWFELFPYDHHEPFKERLISKAYTDRERTMLQKAISAGYRTVLIEFMYTAAHWPREWEAPRPKTQDQAKYKRLFDAVQAHLHKTPHRMDRYVIHDVLQGKSGWPTWPKLVMPPGDPRKLETPRFAEDLPWEQIVRFGTKHFYSREEVKLIWRRAEAELIRPECEEQIRARWFAPNQEHFLAIKEQLPDEVPARWNALLNPEGYDCDQIIRKRISTIQTEIKKSLEKSDCTLCGQPLRKFRRYPFHTVPNKVFKALRGTAVPVCGDCLMYCTQPSYLDPVPKHAGTLSTREELLRVVRQMAEDTGIVPPSEPLAYLAQVPKEQILTALAALWQLPYGEDRKELYPEGWLHLLAEAGILDRHTNKTIGHYCTAEDGHPCRSRAEKFIDDWLFRNGIPHQCEPAYPYDAEWNPNRMRADFQAGEVWIEYFGLMSQPEYKSKADTKVRLAEKHRIRLVSLYPEDLSDEALGDKLGFLMAH